MGTSNMPISITTYNVPVMYRDSMLSSKPMVVFQMFSIDAQGGLLLLQLAFYDVIVTCRPFLTG